MGVKVHMVPVDAVTRKVDVRRVDIAMCAFFQYFSHTLTFLYVCQSEIPTQFWCVPHVPIDYIN